MEVNCYEVFHWEFLSVMSDNSVIPAGQIQFEDESPQAVWAYRIDGTLFGLNFMPQQIGRWQYQFNLLEQQCKGYFDCVENDRNNHGVVCAKGQHFEYTDGRIFWPFGTTCYAWTNQPTQLQNETLATLEQASFNKVRMCVFPKSMPYNHNDPECYPFNRDARGGWNVLDINKQFWNNLEARIGALQKLGIQADLILFHPYDRWGFEDLTIDESLKYLKYVVVRLGAYANIWWSLANEYEMVLSKRIKDWDLLGTELSRLDSYHHLISIHDILQIYPSRPWLTHCSVQTDDLDQVLNLRRRYRCPVIVDECGYEGDLDFGWGNLSAREMVHRFWTVICRGGYCTHGETFDSEDEILWWAKGGKLHGASTSRIKFLKDILTSLPIGNPVYRDLQDPNQKRNQTLSLKSQRFRQTVTSLPKAQQERVIFSEPMCLEGQGFVLTYLGRHVPKQTKITLPDSGTYHVEVIDTWRMRRRTVSKRAVKEIVVNLPRQEGLAILAIRL